MDDVSEVPMLPNLADLLGISTTANQQMSSTQESSSSAAKKQNGRKRKYRDDESSEDEIEKSTKEEQDKDSDPDWAEGRENRSARSQRSARKKGPVSYREADMFKMQAKQENPLPARGHRRPVSTPQRSISTPQRSIPTQQRPISTLHRQQLVGYKALSPATTPSVTSLKGIIQRLERPQEHEYLTSNPSLKALIPCPISRFIIPSSEKRLFISEIELRDEFTACSGGFRRFVKSISDQILLKLLEILKISWNVDGRDDYVKLGQVMRIMWNMQAESTRLLWEFKAREEVKANAQIDMPRKSIVKEISSTDDEKEVPMEVDGMQNGDFKENLTKPEHLAGKSTIEELTEEGKLLMAKMPLCEQAFMENALPRTRPDRVGLRCSTCKDDSIQMHTFGEIMNHYISFHFLAMHYGCHLCGQIFQTLGALNTHGCERFNQYLLELLLVPGTKANTLEMKFSFFFLACSDCGLCLPISPKFDTVGQVSNFQRQWFFLLNLLSLHNCENLVPIVVYMPEMPDASINALNLRVIPTMCLKNLPWNCDDCGVESFTSPQECEDHFRDIHPSKEFVCNECGEAFGTEPYFKSHCLSHLPATFVLADYLSTQCRYYPPAGDECSVLTLGKTDMTPLGGTGKLLSEFVEDWVGPFDNLLFTKLIQTRAAKKAYLEEKRRKKKEADDYDLDYEETPVDDEQKITMPDLGFEHIQVEMDDDVDANKDKIGLAEYFEKNDEAKALLRSPKTRLLDENDLLERFKVNSTINRKGSKVKFSLQCSNSYAKSWTKQFTHLISLPIRQELPNLDVSALFDSLPEDDRVYLCHCGSICKGSSAAEHSVKCFIDESYGDVNLDLCDKISCISLPSWPSDSRIYCHEANCTASACSVLALRAHLLAKHLKFQPIHGMKVNPVPFVRRSQKKIYQTKLARDSDLALGMKEDGLLFRKNVTFNRSVLPGYQARPMLSSAVGTTDTNNMEIKPFRVSPGGFGKSIYQCNLCRFTTENFKFCALHLINNHADPCNACGSVFLQKVNRELHQMHHGACPSTVPIADRSNPRVRCPICGFSNRIRYVVHHMIQSHYPMIRYHRLDGTMYPLITEIIPELAPQSNRPLTVFEIDDNDEVNRLENGTAETLNKGINGKAELCYYSNPNASFKCFLCDMSFENETLLKAHHMAHPEQWRNCPVCLRDGIDVLISSHEEMRQHIENAHLRVENGKRHCAHCSRILEKRAHSHVVYECTAIKTCMICGLDGFTSDTIPKHRNSEHGGVEDGIMARFECSLCHIKTFTCDYIKEHSCMATFLPHRCTCGNGEIYDDRSAFERHFRGHMKHEKNTSTCLLCMTMIPPGKNCFTHGLQQHVILHKDTSNRRVIVLDQNLLINEEKLIRKKAKEDAKTVKKTLQSLIQQTVLSMGEAWDEDEARNSTDDDDCLIINPNRPTTNGSLLQLPREERDTERAAHTQASSNYFEDEETNELGDLSCVPASPPPIKEVIDENGDDDLAVIAQVEHPAGTLPSTVASNSRANRINCPKCSEKFITEKSLKYHLETAHKFDAGGTILEDLGIPENQAVFLCRSCCVAFETVIQLQAHQKQHTGSNQLNCDRCSMVAYNTQLLDLHTTAHNDGRLTFACHQCHFAYRTDSELYGHLEEKHSVSLIYFCKTCNLGSTNGLLIAEHVISRKCVSKFQTNKNVESNFGVSPAALLHYNPRDLARYKQLLAQKVIKSIEPSICNHRTFVAPSQTMVACLECHCVMNIASFLAHREAVGAIVEEIQYALITAPHILTPQRKMMNLVTRMGTGKYSTINNGANRMPAPQPAIPTANRSSANLNLSAPYNASLMRAKTSQPTVHPLSPMSARAAYLNSLARRTPSATGQIPSKPADLTANLASVLGDMLKSNPTSAVPGRAVAPPPQRAQSQRNPPAWKPQEVVLSDDDQEMSNVQQSSKSSSKQPKNRVGAPCHVCHKSIGNQNILQLHELHTNGHNFFCLDCPISLPDEQAAIEHYFKTHMKKSAVNKDKPLVFDLKCPFHECKFKTGTLVGLRKHLETHDLPHQSSHCTTRFMTKDRCKAHDSEHEKMEEYAGGLETNCCLLCGTLDVWSKRLPNFPMPITHTAIHGLRKFFMCRDCSVCFKHDALGKKLVQHFQKDHVKELPGKPNHFQCKLCQTLISKSDLADHAKQKHYVHGFKKRTRADEGQLVVTTGTPLRMCLGMDPVYYQDDGSDID